MTQRLADPHHRMGHGHAGNADAGGEDGNADEDRKDQARSSGNILGVALRHGNLLDRQALEIADARDRFIEGGGGVGLEAGERAIGLTGGEKGVNFSERCLECPPGVVETAEERCFFVRFHAGGVEADGLFQRLIDLSQGIAGRRCASVIGQHPLRCEQPLARDQALDFIELLKPGQSALIGRPDSVLHGADLDDGVDAHADDDDQGHQQRCRDLRAGARIPDLHASAGLLRRRVCATPSPVPTFCSNAFSVPRPKAALPRLRNR